MQWQRQVHKQLAPRWTNDSKVGWGVWQKDEPSIFFEFGSDVQNQFATTSACEVIYDLCTHYYYYWWWWQTDRKDAFIASSERLLTENHYFLWTESHLPSLLLIMCRTPTPPSQTTWNQQTHVGKNINSLNSEMHGSPHTARKCPQIFISYSSYVALLSFTENSSDLVPANRRVAVPKWVERCQDDVTRDSDCATKSWRRLQPENRLPIADIVSDRAAGAQVGQETAERCVVKSKNCVRHRPVLSTLVSASAAVSGRSRAAPHAPVRPRPGRHRTERTCRAQQRPTQKSSDDSKAMSLNEKHRIALV